DVCSSDLGVAGDYSGISSGGATCIGSGAELSWVQCRAGGGTGVGRHHRGGGRLRHNLSAERSVVSGRDLVSLPLEASDCGSAEDAARGVGNRRRVPLREAERTGEVGAAAHWNLQRSGGGHAGAAADHRSSVWRAGIRRAPGLFWAGRFAGSAGAAATAGKAFGGW